MEEVQHTRYLDESLTVDQVRLRKVPEVSKGPYAKCELLWDSIGDHRDDVALDIVVIPAGDLFEQGNSSLEVVKANTRLQQGKRKINFFTSNGVDGPLSVMVPELLMPMVKGFRGKKLPWLRSGTIWEGPILPEGSVNTIQSETLLSLLDVQFEVPRINIFRNGFKLSEGEGA